MRFSAILWVLTSTVLGCGALESAARPKTLRACADYLPYSNRAGQGFENKIAQAVAKALGTTVVRETRGLQFRIEVDGGVHHGTVADVVCAGAEILVAGSAIFEQGDPVKMPSNSWNPPLRPQSNPFRFSPRRGEVQVRARAVTL